MPSSAGTLHTGRAAAALSLYIITTLSLAQRSIGAEAGANTALLDEIVAGSEANMALIERGTATYVVSWSEYSHTPPTAPPTVMQNHVDGAHSDLDPAQRGPCKADLTVYFNYPRLRFDWRGNGVVADDKSAIVNECYIRDADQLITYNMPNYFGKTVAQRPQRTTNPSAHNVRIEKAHSRRRLMDPRQQLYTGYSLGNKIRRARNDPEVSLEATIEPNGLIRYDVKGRSRTNSKNWVSPELGYCLVRSISWNPDFGESEPIETYEATARDAGNGAYVLDWRRIKSSIIMDDRIAPDYDEEVTLVSIDMIKPPDEKLLTIDGLGLPAGTRIQDRIEGRTYQYAIGAVKERNIEVPNPSGPLQQRHWTVVVYVIAGAGLVFIGFLSYRLRLRGKASAQ